MFLKSKIKFLVLLALVADTHYHSDLPRLEIAKSALHIKPLSLSKWSDFRWLSEDSPCPQSFTDLITSITKNLHDRNSGTGSHRIMRIVELETTFCHVLVYNFCNPLKHKVHNQLPQSLSMDLTAVFPNFKYFLLSKAKSFILHTFFNIKRLPMWQSSSWNLLFIPSTLYTSSSPNVRMFLTISITIGFTGQKVSKGIFGAFFNTAKCWKEQFQ